VRKVGVGGNAEAPQLLTAVHEGILGTPLRIKRAVAPLSLGLILDDGSVLCKAT
jgi:hypothetical protein